MGPKEFKTNQTNYNDDLNEDMNYIFYLILPSVYTFPLCRKEREKVSHPYGGYWLHIVLCTISELRN